MTNLPDFLKLSEEQIAQSAQNQTEIRMKFNNRMRMTPEEEERASAMIREPELSQTVKSLKSALALARKVSREGLSQITSTDIDRTIEELNHARTRLAEALAAQGKFIEAARHAPTKEMRAFYLQIDEAIWKDDEDLCGCPAEVRVVGQDRIILPKFRVVREVFSLKHCAAMNLLECNACANWNVRSLTEDLMKLQKAVNDAAHSEKKPTDIEIFKV